MERSATYRATYSEVLQRGLQSRSPHDPDRPNRAPVHPLAKPPVRVSVTSPSRPVRTEELPTRRSGWNARGMARAKEFVAAVLDGDPQKMHAAYYDPGFGKENKKLFETINERRKSRHWRPTWESHSLVEWFRDAVKGCSLDELRRIDENIYIAFGAAGWVFEEVRKTLVFSVQERIHADELVQTVLKNGNIATAAERFEALFLSAALDPERQRHRMSTLMNRVLQTLDPAQLDRIVENLAQAPDCHAVGELRRLLG
jgi:hypothetical protein